MFQSLLLIFLKATSIPYINNTSHQPRFLTCRHCIYVFFSLMLVALCKIFNISSLFPQCPKKHISPYMYYKSRRHLLSLRLLQCPAYWTQAGLSISEYLNEHNNKVKSPTAGVCPWKAYGLTGRRVY